MNLYEILIKIASQIAETTKHRSSVAIEVHPDGSGVLLHLTLDEHTDEIGTVARLCQWNNQDECNEVIEEFVNGPFFHRVISA